MRNGQAYSWANNEQNIGLVEGTLNEIKDSMTPFDHEFLTVGPKIAQSNAGTSWASSLEKFIGLNEKVVRLGQQAQNIPDKARVDERSTKL